MADNNQKRKNEYALVTGATSGIGYELAKVIAKHGYNLAIVARSSDRLLEVSDEFQALGADVILLDKDLSDPGTAREIYDDVQSKRIVVEILVNNAAQGQHGKFKDIALERHMELVNLNVVSLVALTKLFLTDMASRNSGRILNVASVVSKTPAPEFSIYAASKAFVLSFSEAIAHELKESNVTVTALLPGRTDTDFFYKADMTDTKEYQDHSLADPAKVAKDGFDAMMSGESRVISGAQNKLMVGMMNARTDSSNAEKMHKNMQPSDKDPRDRKQSPGHTPSEQEREALDKDEQLH
jgi:uncharacterized protein